MKQIIFTIVAFMFISLNVAAQKKITGIVTDVNNDPLIGVTVSVNKSTTATSTDLDGKYEIMAGDNDVITFSYVGMVTENVAVKGKSVINVKMVDNAVNLNEVVAIGYGVSKKSDLTGSVASVKAADLANSKVGTVTTALQGLAAGVQVTTGSAKPGGDAQVIIRGVGTLGAGSNPLYIVDGIPVEGGLQDLSSVDIESIEILKDASSASIYGSRGANGVVLVSTKKGASGRTKISVNASVGTQRMLNKQELMNAQEYYDLVNFANPDNVWNAAELRLLSRGESTDWQDAVMQNGNYQNYNVSVSGGTENITHYLGLDWYDQKGTIKGSSFDKLTVRYNMDAKVSKFFRYGLRFNVIESNLHNINEEQDSGYGTMHSAISSQPTAPIFNDDGTYFDDFPNTRANPVAIVDLLDKVTKKSRIVGGVYFEVEPIKNLIFRSSNDGELVFYRDNLFEDGAMGQHYTEGGHARIMSNKKRFWQSENTLSYKHNIGKHSFTAMGGFSASNTFYEEATADSKNLSSILKYYYLQGAEDHGPNSSWAVESSLVSFYGRLNYTFYDRYLATFTMRADASSRFAPGNKWGYFPSLALAWRISEEDFVKNNLPVISNMKLRLSAGQLGNQNIGDFQYLARIRLDGNYVLGNSQISGSIPISVSNPDLTWETTNQYDLAIDFGLFNNRIAGTLETYYKSTTDLLWSVPMPLESGYNSTLKNVGQIDNKGVEFSLNTVNVTTKDFLWTSAFNISYNENEIKELYDGKKDVNKSLFVGKPIDNIYLLHSQGIWQLNEAKEAAKYNAQPGDRKVFDRDDNGSINGDDRIDSGNYRPKFFGSFTNTFRYKDFDLVAFFTFAGAYKINNSLNAYLNSYNKWGNMSKNYYKYYWREDVPNNRYPAPRLGSPYANGDGTDANLQRGDYLRLRNLELGYSLPQSIVRKIKATNVRFYFSVQNVFTATEFTGFDVESSDNTNPYPNARSFIGGVSVNF